MRARFYFFLSLGLLTTLAALTMLVVPCRAQTATKRLILKDGSYQVTTKWEIQGDRVHYFSAERNEWEDVPNSLVDWNATNQYEKDRVAGKMSPEAKTMLDRFRSLIQDAVAKGFQVELVCD